MSHVSEGPGFQVAALLDIDINTEIKSAEHKLVRDESSPPLVAMADNLVLVVFKRS